MPAEKLIIVTEGKTDVLIIRALLNKELTAGMRFFAGQGRESLVTLGRNLLVHEGGPVLLVMDFSTAELQFKDEMLAKTLRGSAPSASQEHLRYSPLPLRSRLSSSRHRMPCKGQLELS